MLGLLGTFDLTELYSVLLMFLILFKNIIHKLGLTYLRQRFHVTDAERAKLVRVVLKFPEANAIIVPNTTEVQNNILKSFVWFDRPGESSPEKDC